MHLTKTHGRRSGVSMRTFKTDLDLCAESCDCANLLVTQTGQRLGMGELQKGNFVSDERGHSAYKLLTWKQIQFPLDMEHNQELLEHQCFASG